MAKRKQDVPPLVGRKKAAELLGVRPTNLGRNNIGKVLPPSLQEEYGEDYIDVSATSLWRRADIERIREEMSKT